MITNDPFGKRRLTYSHVWWDGAFEPNQLDKIEEYCSSLQLHDGVTVGGNKDFRLSKLTFVNRNENTSWIFNTFNNVIESLNDQFYGFNLYGYDTFQYTTYDADVLGKYDWHMDTIFDGEMQDSMREQSTRKLTLVMVLNDGFTGGEFQMNLGSEENAVTLDMPRGKIYTFPSFIPHRVKPVLTGTRKSIVIWVEGPKFV